eukprot:TRINITY_DN2925_c0_g1_i2.p1 TRINITY_DN2925_c0_g1~~TRINITY_DN2925_c0_g1_i2.p1  ORF type:complete len:247 (+),score=32.45 TRINITY_DN2925_c0_g1_i2:271-1011(+)
MSRLEYITPEGYRLDGRKATEIRRLQCKFGIFSRADGSAYLEQGNTKVIVAVYGPREVQFKKAPSKHDRGTVSVEFSQATFSTTERKKKSKGDRRGNENSLFLKQTFESIVITSLFPRSQIDIYVQVLQSDGSVTSACVNAITLALLDAGVPMHDMAVACSSGILNSTPVLDLNHIEGTAEGPELTVVIFPHSTRVISLQMDSRVPLHVFENITRLASEGAKKIYQILQQEVRTYQQLLISSGKPS